MKNLFLIGYRCTGKTSVGRSLAAASDWPFLDADSELVRECGMTIDVMVEKYGWPFFREKERCIIKKLSALGNRVVATGGGVVLDPRNVKLLKETGVVVWLRASAETIKQRILEDRMTESQRPALTSKGLAKGLLEEIDETLHNRAPLYRDAMDFRIDTDEFSIDEVCRIIVDNIRATGLLPEPGT